MGRSSAAAAVAGTLIGIAAFTATFVVVTDRAGEHSKPVVSRPAEQPSSRYSVSVETTPPWWGVPASLLAGCAVGAASARALRPRS